MKSAAIPQAPTSKSAAIDEVRRRAKEKGNKAVHRENINFGAARNAFGLKPFGLGACVMAALGLGAAILLRKTPSATPLDIVVAMAIVTIAATWMFACTADRVRHHAEAYARALFEAIEVLVPRRAVERREGARLEVGSSVERRQH
jgi:hypothetical protein